MRASGAFYTDFLDGFTNVYHNASSLVARLSWPSSRPEAVLLNAHYDSFPGSPGGSDNAVNVGAALGAVRALAAGPALPVSVLLLLNGGEESNWVGAHAFATGGHAWAAYEWWSGPCGPLPSASAALAASAPCTYSLARRAARGAEWPRARCAATALPRVQPVPCVLRVATRGARSSYAQPGPP